MIKTSVNAKANFEITAKGAEISSNGQAVNWSAVQLPTGDYHLLIDGKSFMAQVLKIDREAKTVTIEIDHQEYEVALEEPMDRLLAAMGIKDSGKKKINDIKAPMPGMVLKILVTPGQHIAKGDPVLILEAMKMENVFKSATDAVVKEIKVKERTAVEKGEVLVVLE
ncbi:acetyl-CoA carboxylase biotin carboxyl carrier protein subunit [uncultured Chitinophaga sp.]|uniref:acetyl-CoA carboxylase biotin carboxyl carrier protein subunit n=1 Tax=uncultured Chitinophaga sp. TaxID=339340 RepID=UPI0025EE5001|nr:acetyl-CoA carboxylase biotin carboxyl carrier protein subunit [uncultured Chitinophaga sp.]